jgi:outer membrane protein assembly factor BamB
MIVKVDLAGKVVWAKVVDATAEPDSLNDIALPAGSNALFAVGEAGVPNIGGSRRARLVKLGLDGAPLWSRDYTSSQNFLTFERLVVAPDGDLIVVGVLRGSALIAGATAVAPSFDDVLVLRLSPEADAVRWWRVFGGGSPERVSDVALAPDGLVAVSGHFMYEMTVDKNVGFKGGDASEGFVVALDGETGDLRWAKPLAGSADLLHSRVAFDAASNLTVVGTFLGPGGSAGGKLNLFGMDVASIGSYDGFIVRTTRDGAPFWRRVVGGPAQDLLLATVVDEDIVFALGSTSGGYLFGGVQVKTGDNQEDGVVYAFAP